MPDPVPDWILQLQCLEVLSIELNREWQVQMLADHLPELKEISLYFIILEFIEYTNVFAQFLKFKNLRVLRICWSNYSNFKKINFRRFCSIPHVTFFELMWQCSSPGNDITSFLTSMPQIFPNLQHLDICGQKFRHETLLYKLSQLTKLRKLGLST